MSSSDEYASPPCAWHEFDEPDPSAGVAAWRRDERRAQLARRQAISADRRAAMDARILSRLEASLGPADGLRVSLYWPIRGEPDLRSLIPRLIEAGGSCALPVVVERGRPLVFRSWAPGEPLERGIWNIPVPAAGREIEPDLILAPVVAFDRNCFRLGYGGGYFDRTLAAISARPRVFGIGYSSAGIASIRPLAHDVAMDAIVTENELIGEPG